MPGRHRIRAGEPGNRPAIARLYNRETAGMTGVRVREPERWLGPRQGLYFGRLDAWVQVALNDDGQIVGYCIGDQIDHDAKRLDIVDAQATSSAVAGSLIRAMAEEAIRHRIGRLDFHVYPAGRVGRYLANLDVSLTTERPIGRSQMVRIGLPGVVLEALQPYARERAEALGPSRPARLAIETELGSGELALGGEAPARKIRLPADRLCELLFGYRSAEELRNIHGVRLAGRNADLLDALFPRLDAYCYWPDRY